MLNYFRAWWQRRQSKAAPYRKQRRVSLACEHLETREVLNGTVAGTVWYDTDGSGSQTGAEGGLSYFDIGLIRAGGGAWYYTTTDSAGHYSFNVPTGSYYVHIPMWNVQVHGGSFDAQGKSSTFYVANNGVFFAPDAFVSWGGFLGVEVWHDYNGDGVNNDWNDPPIDLSTFDIELNSGSAGAIDGMQDYSYLKFRDEYSPYLPVYIYFNYLKMGSQQMQLVAPDWTPTMRLLGGSDFNADGTSDWQVTGSDTFQNLSLGIYKPVSLTDTLYEDVNGDGIRQTDERAFANVDVDLMGWLPDGTPLLRTATTDSDGVYSFTDLPPGSYQVFIHLPGLTVSGSDAWMLQTTGTDGSLFSVPYLFSGDARVNGGTGFYPDTHIAGRVWWDENRNGWQDDSSVSNAPVQVTLYRSDDTEVASVTTVDTYAFENLPLGDYYLRFDTSAAGAVLEWSDPPYVSDTKVHALTGQTELITLGLLSTQVDGINAAFYMPDPVFALSASHSELPEYDPSGSTVDVTVSIAQPRLADLWVELQFGGTATAGADYYGDSNGVIIPAGETSVTFTLTAFPDGEFESLLGEAPEDIVITCAQDPSVQLVIPILDMTADAIESLEAAPSLAEGGSLVITATLRYPLPVPLQIPLTFGGDAVPDVDFSGEFFITVNALGLGSQTVLYGIDDGIYEGIDEPFTISAPGQAPISVSLQDTTLPQFELVPGNASLQEGQGTTFTVRITNAAEDYQGASFSVPLGFSGPSSSAHPDFTAPDALTFAAGSTEATFEVTGLADNLFEGLETFSISVADTWVGSFDLVDDTLPQVSLAFDRTEIHEDSAAGITTATLTATLVNLDSEFALPAGMPAIQVLLDFQGADGAADFSAPTEIWIDLASGYSASVEVQAWSDSLYEGTEVLSVGIANSTAVAQEGAATIDLLDDTNPFAGSRVWLDDNGNGVQDEGEASLAGVTVSLLNSAGQVLDTASTGADGTFCFGAITPGTYWLQFTPPAGHHFTQLDIGNESADNDVENHGFSPALTLTYGMQSLDVDAGMFQNSGVVGSVWVDADMDGFRSSGELGIANAVVTLWAGNQQWTTLTDGQGAYSFADLVPGSYEIEFSNVSGMLFCANGVASSQPDGFIYPLQAASGQTTQVNLPVDGLLAIDAPPTFAALKDTDLVFGSISLVAASGSTLLQVELACTHGQLSLPSGAGVTIDSASVPHHLVFSGTLAQCNAALLGLIFTPELDYLGTATLQIQVQDDGSNSTGLPLAVSKAALITITDEAPSVANLNFSVSHDSVLSILPTAGVLGGAYDPLGLALQVVDVNGSPGAVGVQTTLPSGGQVTVFANGALVYQSPADTTLSDSFTCGVSNGVLTSTVTVTIAVINETPQVSDLTLETPYSQWLVRDAIAGLLSEASDEDGDALAITQVNGNAAHVGAPFALPSGAWLQVGADGAFIYCPPGSDNATASDSFTITVSDGISTTLATVTVQLTGQEPILTTQSPYYVLQESTLTASALHGLLAGADDPQGFTLNITKVNGQSANVGQALALASGATLTVQASGSFTYTAPADGSTPVETIAFTVSNGVVTTEGEATITVLAQSLFAQQDAFELLHDETQQVDEWAGLLSNDVDLVGQSFTISAVQGSTGNVGTAVTLASGGQITVQADGAFEYTPATHWVGVESFSYTISNGSLSSTATVTLTVYDAAPEMEQEVAYSTSHSQMLTVAASEGLLAYALDADLDALTVTKVEGSAAGVGSFIPLASGAQVLVMADGMFQYLPTVSGPMVDTFTYTISDGVLETTVTARVTVTNEAPLAHDQVYSGTSTTVMQVSAALGLLADALDSDDVALGVYRVNGVMANVGTTLTLASGATLLVQADGSFVYTPDPTAPVLGDSFTFTVYDGMTESAAATVYLDIIAPPAPVPPAYTIHRNLVYDTQVEGVNGVLANFSSPTNLPTIHSHTNPSHGTLTLDHETGHFVYTPSPGYVGSDSFEILLSDDETLVEVALSVVNDAPVAANDGIFVVVAGSTLTGAVLGNDIDANGDTLTVSPVQGPLAEEGVLQLNADGTFTFTPAEGFLGQVSFTYQTSDDLTAAVQTATVRIDVVQEFVWTGGAGTTSWSDAANWNANDVPDINTRVRIGAGAIVDLTADDGDVVIHDLQLEGVLNVSGSLTLNADSRLSDLRVASAGHVTFASETVSTLTGGVLEGQVSLLQDARLIQLSGGVALLGVTVDGEGTLCLQEGTLIAEGLSHVGKLVMDGGTLRGVGRLTVHQSFEWNGGVWRGSGETEIAAGATLTVNYGDQSKAILDRVLVNRGRVDWVSSETISLQRSSIYNHATGEFNFLDNAILLGASSTVYNEGHWTSEADDVVLTFGTVTNAGTLTVVDGQLTIGPGTFANAENVVVQEGKLLLLATGTSSGNFNIQQDAVLEFGAAHTLTSESTVCCAGAVAVSAGACTVNGTFSPGVTSITGGTLELNTNVTLLDVILAGSMAVLSGSGEITVMGGMHWTKGTVAGSGLLRIHGDATLTLSDEEGDGLKLLRRNLTNEGRLLWYGEVGAAPQSGMLRIESVTLTNDASGRMYLYGGVHLQVLSGGNFLNRGTVTKEVHRVSTNAATYVTNFYGPAAGSPAPAVLEQILNWGILAVKQGTLQIGTGVSAGVDSRILLDASSQLVLATGDFFLENRTRVLGAGTLCIRGGGLRVNTPVQLENLELDAGEVSGPASLTILRQMIWNGGRMVGRNADTNIGHLAVNYADLPRAQVPMLYLGTGAKYLDRVLNIPGLVLWGNDGSITRPMPGLYDTVQASGGPNIAGVPTYQVPRLLTFVQRVSSPLAQSLDAAATTYVQAIDEARKDMFEVHGFDSSNPMNPSNYAIGAEPAACSAYKTANNGHLLAYEDASLQVEATYLQKIRYARRLGGDAQAQIVSQASNQRFNDLSAEGDLFAAHDEQDYRAYLTSLGQTSYRSNIGTALETYQNALRIQAVWGVIDARSKARQLQIRIGMSDYAGMIANGGGLGALPAESRASIAIAYHQVFGRELRDAAYAISTSPTAQFESYFGQSSTPPSWPLLADPWNTVVRGLTSAVTQVSSITWNDVVSTVNKTAAEVDALRTEIGNNIGEWAWNSYQLARRDPVAFAGSVLEAHRNVQVVAFNTLTFGLIPSVNAETQALIQQNSFYRVVEIGAVIGREVAISALTGGVGTVVSSAGRLTAGMALRYGGIGMARATLRAGATLGCMATSAQRLTAPLMLGMQTYGMVNTAQQARSAWLRGDRISAAALMAESAIQLPNIVNSFRQTARLAGAALGLGPQNLRDYLRACFAGGTPILWEHGSKPIEEFVKGERVWARNEFDPEGPLELKEIEETFVTEAQIWTLRAGGQEIRTTGEHPFWVQGQGWTEVCNLKPGDLLVSHDGQSVAVEEVLDTGEFARVYNFRVADYHTYFVGSESWGWSAWSHNICGGLTTGDIGETRARDLLIARGNRYLGQIQNRSGHGVDLVFRNSRGRLFFVEVKSSTTSSAPSLSAAQRRARNFVITRTEAAVAATRHWADRNQIPGSKALADSIIDEVRALNFMTVRLDVTNLGAASELIRFRRW